MSFEWEATQYLRFEKQRNQALYDLIAKCKQFQKPSSIGQILDIGCGLANSTKILAHCFKNAQILGIDNSQNMLNQAQNNIRSKRVRFRLLCANTQLHTLKRKI